MNTHTSRAWMFSLVLLAACAAGSDPPVGTDEPAIAQAPPPAPVAPATPHDYAADLPAAPTPAPTAAPTAAPTDPTDVPPPPLKTLNIAWQRQETGYWCGPGATRIVLSTRDTNLPTQTTLAKELGTTTNGTDYIGSMVKVLNTRWKLTGSDAYVVRDMYDPPTAQQRAQLKTDIVKHISGGYGIVINVISGWRPPNYPTGTIYHYVTVVGYDANGDRVLVADPAAEGYDGTAWKNVPRTYWVDIEDLGTWIGGKGYTG